MMLYYKILSVCIWIQNNTNSSLMIYNIAFWIIFNIVTTVETTITKNILYFNALVWRFRIFWSNLYVFGSEYPWFLLKCWLLSLLLLNLKLLISYSMLYTHFNITNISFNLFIMSFHFLTHIRINKLIYLILKLHLSFRNKTHIKHPFFIVLIF